MIGCLECKRVQAPSSPPYYKTNISKDLGWIWMSLVGMATSLPLDRHHPAMAGQATANWLGADVEADSQTRAAYSNGHFLG